MATSKLYNLARMTTATTGTGTLTLGSAVSGFLTFAQAGVQDGETVSYSIKDGVQSEVGRGVYTASGTTLTRSVLKSTNSNSAINLSGAAEVMITALAEDLITADSSFGVDNALVRKDGTGKLLQSTGLIVDDADGLSGLTALNGGQLAGFRNAVINGAMMVAQRGTSFTSTGSRNNDDTYNLDRWTLLSDGNNIVNVTQEASVVPTDGLYAMALTTVTAAKKFGTIQFIEQKSCIGLIGQTCTLSFKAKVSNVTNLSNIKAGIISWSSTADTLTSDVVSSWDSDGTTPTLAANWTFENTPANLSVTTSYATFSISALIDTASTKNIALFIWCDDPAASGTGDVLYVTDVQHEIGSQATPFERRPFGVELALCQRYFAKSFPIGTTPADNGVEDRYAGFAWAATALDTQRIMFPVTMFKQPTVTFYSPNNGTPGQWSIYDGTSAYQAAATTTAITTNLSGFNISLTGLTVTTRSAYITYGGWTAAAEL